MSHAIDLSVFIKAFDQFTKPMKQAEGSLKSSSERIKKSLTMPLVVGGLGYATKKISNFAKNVTDDLTESSKKINVATGELRSLGMENVKAVVAEGQRMQSTYVGLTTDAFTRAAYDIKSGISSLTDEGVAAMTASAVTTAKATKGVPEMMTSLFATSYGIFKKQFADMSDADWGDMFGAALSKSVQQFKTDGAKMQQAIETTGAGATNLGMKMTEQMALLGMMQTQMQAGDAGTALKSFATNAAKAHEAFGKLSTESSNPIRVNILDENGQLRAMPDILTDLKARYGDTLDAFEAAEIKDAFGTEEAMKMINALYGQEEAVRANAAALDEAAGQGKKFTEDMAADMDDYDGAGWELFIQRIDVMKQKVGAGLLPAMDALTPVLSSIVESFGDFATEHPKLVAGFGLSIGGVAALGSVLGPLTMSIGGITAATRLLGGGGESVGLLAKSFGGLKSVVSGIAKLFITNPILLAVVAIAAAAYLIYKNWEPIKAFFGRLWEGTKNLIANAIEGLKFLFFNFTPIGLIYSHWSGITAWFGQLWEGTKNFIANAIEGLKFLFFNFTPLGLIYSHWSGIATWFGQKWEQVKQAFSAKFQSIKAMAATWPKAFLAIGGNIIQGLMNGLTSKLAELKSSVLGIGSKVAGWFKSKMGIHSPSRVFMGFGQNLGDGLAIGLSQSYGGVMDQMAALAGGINKPISGPSLANKFDALEPEIDRVLNKKADFGLKHSFGSLMDQVKRFTAPLGLAGLTATASLAPAYARNAQDILPLNLRPDAYISRFSYAAPEPEDEKARKSASIDAPKTQLSKVGDEPPQRFEKSFAEQARDVKIETNITVKVEGGDPAEIERILKSLLDERDAHIRREMQRQLND